MTSAFETFHSALESLGKNPKKAGAGWTAKCPAHEDKSPSLSYADKGNLVVVRCFAGCETKDVVAALGLELSDLFTKKEGASLSDLVARKKLDPTKLASYGVREEHGHLVWPYKNADGTTFRERIRKTLEPGDGFKWAPGKGNGPYGRDKLHHARKAGWMLVVEGETDCWSAWEHSVPCIGIPGATSYDLLERQDIAGIPKLYVVREPDKAGGEFVEGLLARVRDLDATCKVFELTFDVKDVSELHVKNPEGFDAALKLAMAQARNLALPSLASLAERDGLTDLGNAERLAQRSGSISRFDIGRQSWRVFDGKAWALDDGFAIERLQRDALLAIYAESEKAKLKDAREAIADWAKKSESTAALRNSLAQAKTLAGMQVRREELDRDPMILNCANGTVDLRTGELRAHRREDMLTRYAPVDYDETAECPLFLAFITRIMGGDEQKIDFLRRFLGYALTGDTSEQVLAMWHGEGSNGKSTLLRILRAVLGDDKTGYSLQASFETFIEQKSEKVRSDLARMDGARLVCASEANEVARLDETVIKQITGQERITARFLYGNEFEFTPNCKLVLVANRLPRIRGCDLAIWRRLRVIAFLVTIPREERDPQIAEKILAAEAAGILRWLVVGAMTWHAERAAGRDGLATPDSVLAATNAYRQGEDPVGAFLLDCCDLGAAYEEAAGRLHGAYSAWAKRSSEPELNTTSFGRRMTEHRFEKRAGTGGIRMWRGLRVKDGIATSESTLDRPWTTNSD